MTDPAPTAEPDAIAYMTDVELETFARTVVAERDALAAALESTRADNERLTNWNGEVQHRLDTLARQHVQAAGRFYTDLIAVAADRDAERAKVQAVPDVDLIRRAICDPGQFLPRGDNYTESIGSWGARAVVAALAAAQPTGKIP